MILSRLRWFALAIALLGVLGVKWALDPISAKAEPAAKAKKAEKAEKPKEEKIPPGLKTYKGRRIAHTMHFSGANWLIRESREREEDCSTMLKVLKIKPGEKGAWPERKLSAWLAAHKRVSEEQRQAELGQWMIRSTDGGVTWSARYSSIVNSPHGPIQLSDGRLLYAGKELWTGQKRIGVCESDDDGQTWNWLVDIPAREGDDRKNYHELNAGETNDGKLLVHIRNHNQANAGETLQSESTDGGRTWTMPHSIGVWGLPSFLMRLRDGRLLMSYGHRRKPFGNQARVSEDSGKTWSEAITISGDGASGDLGYPSTVQLDDDSLVTVWYEQFKDSPYAVLRQARWELES